MTGNTGGDDRHQHHGDPEEWNRDADPAFDYDVLIVGGGPVGMLLAAELRIARVRTVVLERLTERSPHSKAFGLHARSLESLDRRGLAKRFRDGARSWNNGHFAGLDEWVDFSALDSSHAYALLSEQVRTERLLEERAVEVTAEIRRGHDVTAVRQDADAVEADVTGPDGGYTLRARYIVGCDGGRSLVRQQAGISFPGTGGRVTARLGDVILADRENAPMGMERTERGLLFCVPLDDTYHRVSTFDFEQGKEQGDQLTMDELSASLREVWGDDLGAHSPRWLSWFTDSACQADRYREGRVLLAGDAAHTHFPVGGQGVNLGLQDVFNLGWKLAATVHGYAADGLLDTYDRERQAPARKVLANTRAQIALMNPDPYVTELRALFTDLMRKDQVNLHLAEMLSGVTVRYDLPGPEHRLLGDFARDLELRTADGKSTLPEYLRRGNGLLLDLGGRPEVTRAFQEWSGKVAWDGRLRHVRAECDQEPRLAALLVRPDGYVAFAGDRDLPGPELRQGLDAAIATWFGSR
ncbi:FAD-dependent monooxygenase [Streptomyces albipurpureus]|uniref:FAD-dependent monooxygenase n=1 Tax=Streptomyces albipurpureus TaxID=2897419 RepID=A0ABT0UF47_9ACTN|nr:FAD-dependent monooxygenase [Streptomyces sp. CWNU-1]MCM2387223.1 FAD-dependent monooxygenase [Streptomyces sp. CWNU-1]